MSKIRYHKRIMPKNGRMENGAFKPDFWQGYEDAHSDRYRTLEMRPMCLTARSRDYWLGNRQARIDLGLEQPKKRRSVKEVVGIQNAEYRVIQSAVLSLGLDYDRYLAEGGRPRDLLALLPNSPDKEVLATLLGERKRKSSRGLSARA